MDEILKAFNLTYDQLNETEKQTLQTWLEALEKTQKEMTVADILSYIRKMKDAIGKELSQLPNGDQEKNVLLKARLANYILLEEFLTTPQRAKEAFEGYMKFMSKTGKKYL